MYSSLKISRQILFRFDTGADPPACGFKTAGVAARELIWIFKDEVVCSAENALAVSGAPSA
jgi:hypothetical protein